MKDERVSGITTGTAATAAALASLLCLKGETVKTVTVKAPAGAIEVDVESVERLSMDTARASVVKRPYPDPDVTVNLEIVATVKLKGSPGVEIRGGRGVGTVTKPGLQVPPGEPAINPVPRKMIMENLEEHLDEDEGVAVTISVPGGEEVASRTMNPRLGIMGGISILGTTGIARPMSSKAYRESLACHLDIAVARGFRTVIMVPGNIGAGIAREYFKDTDPDAIIQMGNFPGYMLAEACRRGVGRIILLGHAGKLIKLAAGIFNTKNSVADGRRETMIAYSALEGVPGAVLEAMYSAGTTEEMIEHLERTGLTEKVFNRLADAIKERCGGRCSVPMEVLITTMDGRILNSNFRVPDDIHTVDGR